MVLHISKVLWTLPVSRWACQSINATSNFEDFANQPNWPKSLKRLAITCDRQWGSGCLLKASTCCANFYTGLIMALLLLPLKCNLCFLRNISWLFARSALAQTSVTGSIGKMLSVITTLTGISGFLIKLYLISHCATFFLQKYISIASWDFSLLSYFLQCKLMTEKE